MRRILSVTCNPVGAAAREFPWQQERGREVRHPAIVTGKVLSWPLPPGQSSPAQVQRLLDNGVDGIITDNPILVRHEITAAGSTTT